MAAPQYQLARQSMALAVTDPFINPDTGYPVICAGLSDPGRGEFRRRRLCTHHTERASELLAKHKASPNSITVIADQYGKLLAHPVPGKAVRLVDGQLRLTIGPKLDDPQVVEAIRRHASGNDDRFTFELGPDGTEYVALFSQFPAGFAKDWQVSLSRRPTISSAS